MENKLQKSILLICYSFPPNKGIGGRRWAKFAKHLANDGYDVHVICKKPEKNEASEWTSDAAASNIFTYPLAARYPKILTSVPHTFFQKLEYRIWLLLFKFLSHGTFPERTFFWKKQVLKKADELIHQKKIKNVVATVPPFRIGYYASFLKDKFPDLNFILDYRDPWTDNKTFHGFMNLSEKRFQHELEMELNTLKRANCVLTANEQMTSWLKEKLKDSSKKFVTLPNGYDKDDIHILENKRKENRELFRFIYAGTFYSNVEYILLPFLDTIQKLEAAHTDFTKHYVFDFYGEMDPKMKNLFTRYNLKSVHLHPPVRLKAIQNLIQQSDYCLMFAAHDHSFAFNTKFYEYLANRKPIVIFSKEGEVPNFLVKNQLGVAIEYENFEANFSDFLQKVPQNGIAFNSKFDTEQFSTQAHAKLLQKQFI